MKLDIYVQDRRVGVLEQTDITQFVFTYLPDVPPELAVSLLMPPRTQSWTNPFLFPVFQVSLPEGAVRQRLERSFAKNFPVFNDMALLAIVGENLVGQVKAVPFGQPLSERTVHESLSNLLGADLTPLVEHYLGADGRGPGVSGGFLKFLASSPVGDTGTTRTVALDEWIVKLEDPERDHIVLLEHFGMMAARKMGLPTAQTHLSESGDRLLVKRFDVDSNGMALGFEDMCAMMGRPSHEKFTGSAERIVKMIKAFCPGRAGLAQLEQFYSQYLLTAAIRNGDAHLKNFGFLYEPGKAPTLAPVYDMLSMSVYAPRNDNGDAMDDMALTLGGTKRWPSDKAMGELAHACHVTPSRQAAIKKRLGQALTETAQEVAAYLREKPQQGFCAQASRMIELWSHGLRMIDPATSEVLMETVAQIEGMDFKPVSRPTRPAG